MRKLKWNKQSYNGKLYVGTSNLQNKWLTIIIDQV